jgi:hypothetical protein
MALLICSKHTSGDNVSFCPMERGLPCDLEHSKFISIHAGTATGRPLFFNVSRACPVRGPALLCNAVIVA